jgi:hypothetical protein
VHRLGRPSLLGRSGSDVGSAPAQLSAGVDRLRASRQVVMISAKPRRRAQQQEPCSLTLPVEFAFAAATRKERSVRPERPPKVQRSTLSSSFAPRVVVPKPGSQRRSDDPTHVFPRPPRDKSPVVFGAPAEGPAATATRSPRGAVVDHPAMPLTKSALEESSLNTERMPLGERLRRFLQGLASGDEAVVDEDEARVLISSAAPHATADSGHRSTGHARHRSPTPPRLPPPVALAHPARQPLARPGDGGTQLPLPLGPVAANARVRGGRYEYGASEKGREAQVEDGSRPSKKARIPDERQRQALPPPRASRNERDRSRKRVEARARRQTGAEMQGRTREGRLRG